MTKDFHRQAEVAPKKAGFPRSGGILHSSQVSQRRTLKISVNSATSRPGDRDQQDIGTRGLGQGPPASDTGKKKKAVITFTPPAWNAPVKRLTDSLGYNVPRQTSCPWGPSFPQAAASRCSPCLWSPLLFAGEPLSQRGLLTPPLALCTGTAMPVKLPGAQRVFGTGESFIPEPAASGDGQPVPGRVP